MGSLTTADEVRSALTRAAVFDRSARGRILLRGRDGLDLLHRLSTNDLRAIPPGAALPTVLTTEKGRIIDAIHVLPVSGGHLLLTSAGAEEEIVQWIGKFTITEEAELEVVTAATAQFTLAGPETGRMLASAGSGSAGPGRERAEVTEGMLRLVHLIVPAPEAAALRELLLGAGAAPAGNDAWEVLRIMHGVPERPRELRQDFNPYDVSLRGAISYTKGCYIGQEVIARLDTYQKARRALVGLRSAQGPIPPGSILLSESGEEAGIVTSQAPVPFGGQWLGLAVARTADLPPGKAAGVRGSGLTAFTESFPIRIPQA